MPIDGLGHPCVSYRCRVARRSSSSSKSSSSPLTLTAEHLPQGPVVISTGTAELIIDRDDPLGVFVMVNGVPSSYLKLDDPQFLAFEYMQQMATVIDGLAPGPLRVVHLGAAGCAMARYVAATRPGSRQLGIDLDTQLLELVRTWFNLPRSPELRLRAGDARAELATLRTASADVIIRDAFAPDKVPAHMQTREFTQEVARVLAPGGVYLANTADGGPLSLARSEAATVQSALEGTSGEFALMSEIGVLKGRRYGNIVLAASFDATDVLHDPRTARFLRALAVPAGVITREGLRQFVGTARPRIDPEPDPGDIPR